MNDYRKSDKVVVPMKPANKGPQPLPSNGQRPAELVEERTLAEGNVRSTPADGTQGSNPVSRGLSGIREAARRDRNLRFTALFHHVTETLLIESYESLNPRAAVGVDQVTWAAYGEQLRERIADLKDRLHSGRYRAQPSLRCYIPKPDGQQRPLGIAALEDKIAQRALVWILEQIYEVDFKNFSYGYRPNRCAHDALDALTVSLTEHPIQWVIDADIQSFFDTVDHDWMMTFLEHRIGDKRVLRLIRKWLRAGVSEEGQWSPTTEGMPQGSVISPLLANLYMHHVLDLWIDWWRHNQATGQVTIIRYADDFVIGFQNEQDARRCLAELPGRMQKFGLCLHPEKTRLIEFGSWAAHNRKKRGDPKPESFTFLGFTHSCSRSRKGHFTVRRKSDAKRMRMKLRSLKNALFKNRHLPIPVQGAWLRQVIQGWQNYHAVPYNIKAVDRFDYWLGHIWWRTLRRRSQYAVRTLWWPRMSKIIKRWFPKPRIIHPWPNERFAVKHPR